jgi:hypothetical protein
MKPGDLVQIRRGVTGMGDIGIVMAPSAETGWGSCLDVLFHDGLRRVHPSNLQAVDGRTRPRR